MSWNGNNTCVVTLLSHGVATSSLFQSDCFRGMIESTRWIRRPSEGNASSDSKHFPTTTELSNVVGTKITMDEPVFVEVKQRDADSLHCLLWKLLSVLSHIKHEILGSCIRSLHGDAVTRLRHGFRIGCVLDCVMNANHSGHVMPRQVEVLSNLQFPFHNFRFRCKFSNDLLTLLSSDQTKLLVNTVLRPGSHGGSGAHL
mmetsp:Transcript_26767/g.58707  ORF Transcript_26767/g.58707 Transcript_26767/m.58707 type:complete len:200 (-) Transcript_26767:518-1117(-)